MTASHDDDMLNLHLRRTDQLEGRVTGLEVNVRHALDAIEKTNKSMAAGFAETRNMFIDAQRREEERTDELYKQIRDIARETLKARQVNWPLVVAIIAAAISLVGAGVSYVNMTVNPVADDVAKLNEEIDEAVENAAILKTRVVRLETLISAPVKSQLPPEASDN